MESTSPAPFEFFVNPFLFTFTPSQPGLSVTLSLPATGLKCCSFTLSPTASQYNLGNCKNQNGPVEWSCGWSMSGVVSALFSASGKNNVVSGNAITFEAGGNKTPAFSGVMGGWIW